VGVELRDITPEELEATPSVTVIADRKLIGDDPDMIEGFLRGYAKGVWLGQSAPEAVRQMYKKMVPDDWRDAPVASATLDASFEMYDPENDEVIGELFPDKWEAYEKRLLDGGGLEKPVNIVDTFDEQFIGPANDWDRDEVTAEAEAWLAENK
jgi:NitT/TauT family transport system substrate-binding protein